MKTFEKVIRNINGIAQWVCVALLIAVFFISVTDVVGRYVFDSPIRGAHEASEVIVPVVVLFSWGYTSWKGGHVRIDLFVSRFPHQVRRAILLFSYPILLLLFSLVAWQGIERARFSWETGQAIENMIIDVPKYPFFLCVSIGAILIILEMIIEFIAAIRMREYSKR